MTRIKSIFFLTYHFPPEVGGIQTRIEHYIGCLRDMNVRVLIFFAVTQSNRLRDFTLHGAEVSVDHGQAKYLLQNLARLRRMIVLEKVDAVHVFTGVSTLLSLVSLTLGRLRGIPSVISIFGREEFDVQSLRQRVLFNFAASLATSIAVNSSYTKSQLPRRLQSKTTVILGGAEFGNKPPNEEPSGDGQTILYVGRLVRSKGIDDLLRAFKELRNSLMDSRLVIVGDGPERANLEALSKELEFSDVEVEFKGTLRGSFLDREYGNSTLVVLPSKRVTGDPAVETFGLTLVEALMHGKPVIGTALGGIPEIVEDGVNGYLVPESSPHELASALMKLLSDRAKIETLGQNALVIGISKFSWQAATERLLESYER